MVSDAPPAISGTVLPAGDYRITAAENRQLCEALYATAAPDGSAHPIYSFIATQTGIGVTVDGLLVLCEFDAADGPMMGSSHTRYFAPLRVDETYRIEGEILGLTRKASRKLGVIDVLEYRLSMHRSAGERVLEITNTWILPRRQLRA